jgi:hypothetical protein
MITKKVVNPPLVPIALFSLVSMGTVTVGVYVVETFSPCSQSHCMDKGASISLKIRNEVTAITRGDTLKRKLVAEIEKLPEDHLPKVLDFVGKLNAKKRV